MMPVFLLRLSLVVFGIDLAASWISARAFRPALGGFRALRWIALGVLAAASAGFAVWAGAREDVGRAHWLAELLYTAVHLLLPVTLVTLAVALVDRRRPAVAARPNALSRRALLRLGGAAVPTTLASAYGVRAARSQADLREVRMAFPNLHADLRGFKILQLSDLHLGIVLGLDDLRRGLERAMLAAPDLIVITGDLSNDPTLVKPALDLIASAGARFGAVAVLGNHEYLVGIESARAAFGASAVRLLVSEGMLLPVGRAHLHIGGADDPVTPPSADYFQATVGAASAGASAADFRLLLCHRPEGFAAASEHGYELTLSGHTHGGQLGFLGRSIIDLLRPAANAWGAYGKRVSGRIARLYTTSGFGHWFPFRFGCPTEMPLIVLERGAP